MVKLTEVVGMLQGTLLDQENNVSIQGSDEDIRIIQLAMNALQDAIVTETKNVWIAWTNTNLTDGYGTRIPLAVCECKATADRLGRGKHVQGTDCPTEKDIAVRVDGCWMSKINLIEPTDEDKKKQEKEDVARKAENKALELGLTPEDIMSIKNGN